MDKIELQTLPPYTFILMTIYFLQRIDKKVLPCLNEVILEENSNLNVENKNFDYDLFEKKIENYVRFDLIYLVC
jgi:hypothetical protein